MMIRFAALSYAPPFFAYATPAWRLLRDAAMFEAALPADV